MHGRSLMQLAELRAIADKLPRGALVCEVGAWEGASAALLAERRPDVTTVSVENMSGGVGNSEYTLSVATMLMKNLADHRYRCKAWMGELSDFTQLLGLQDKFDAVIIDGDHSEEGTFHDLTAAAVLIKANGFVVVHDHESGRPDLSGVKRAVERFIEGYEFEVEVLVGLSAILRPKTTNVSEEVVNTDASAV